MRGWQHHPFIKITPLFLVGIWLGYTNLPLFSNYFVSLLAACGPLLVIIAVYRRRKQLTFYTLQILMLLIGVITITARYTVDSTFHFSQNNGADYFVIQPTGKPSLFDDGFSVNTKVISAEYKGALKPGVGQIKLTIITDEPVDSFQSKNFRISRSLIKPITQSLNPTSFSQQEYYASHNVYHQVVLTPSNHSFWQKLNNKPGLISGRVNSIHKYCTDRLRQSLGDLSGLLEALLLGDKESLLPGFKSAFIKMGVIHVLAVSGLHVGILFLFLSWILSPLRKFKHGHLWQHLSIIILLWFYATLTGLSPSVVRAVTMFSFITLGKLIYRNPNIYNAIAVSAFVTLLIDPFALLQLGFQLSYLAVIGIVYLYPKIMGWYSPKNKLLKGIWSLLAVSFAAQLAVFPLTVGTFHQFPVYFLLANLLVVPIITLIMFLGFGLLIAGFITPVAGVLAYCIVVLGYLTGGVAYVFEQLPYLSIDNIYLHPIVSWGLWLSLIAILTALLKKQQINLKWGLSLLAVVLLIHLFINVKISNREKLVVLANKSSAPTMLVKGRTAYQLNNFKINPYHHTKNMLDDWANVWHIEHRETPLLSKQKHIYQYHDKTFVVMDKELVLKKINEPLKVEYLIITEDVKYEVDEVLSNFNPSLVIIGLNVGDEVRNSWNNKGVLTYDLSEKGYFEATI